METNVNTIDQSQPLYKWITTIFRIIISVVILYFLISLVQWQNVYAAYTTADATFIFYALAFLTFNLGIRIFKWRVMLYSVKEKPSFYEAFGSVMLGISLGSFTPGEVGEYAGRALHITDARRSHLVGLVLLDKAQIFIVMGVAGFISFAVLTIHSLLYLCVIALILCSVSVLLLLRMDTLANIGHHINKSIFQKPWLTNILDGFSLLKPNQILLTSIYTILFHVVIVFQMYFLLNAFSSISFFDTFIGTSALLFAKSLIPISLGDLGVREAGSIFIFSIFQITQAAALNASLLLFTINIFIPSVVGVYFIRHQQITTSPIFQFFKKSKSSND
jgi:uncharacterized membrane protein YbhN (UPF0104 family)